MVDFVNIVRLAKQKTKAKKKFSVVKRLTYCKRRWRHSKL